MRTRSVQPNRRALSWLSLFALIAVLGQACGERPNPSAADDETSIAKPVSPALELRFDEIRAIHDEVMPERGKLIRLQRNVSAADLESHQQALAKTRLQRADDMMMSWMYADQSLTTLADSLSETEIAHYLDQREQAIRNVADSMQAAIDFAQLVVAQ